MTRIRALIVDDEPIARRGVRLNLEIESDVEIIGECANGLEAVSSIQEQSPDLVFLDVQMPELDGFGVLEAIGTWHMPAVIFVTAYDQYALKAFEVHALDYLLKPFDRERFLKALQHARDQIKRKSIDDVSNRLRALLDDIKGTQKHIERLVIKSAGRIYFLNVEEIDWMEAAGNYVRLHVGRDSHLLRETVNSLESKLDPDKFLRIRRSTIVNIKRIKELHPMFNGEYAILLKTGTELISSRRYRKNLNAILGE
jgi:two-component system LytT family response regulator